jgi:hypothetical protein
MIRVTSLLIAPKGDYDVPNARSNAPAIPAPVL